MLQAQDHTLTNGRWTLPRPGLALSTREANRRIVVADPPEAGWREVTRTDEQATADTELLAVHRVPRD